MNTFTIEELDREEIEFLPPRVVMTTCNPRPCPPPPCAPAPKCEPIRVCVELRLSLSIGCNGSVVR